MPFSSEHAATVFELVAAKVGVAVLPVSFAGRARQRHVVLRPLRDYTESALIVAVWRPDTELPSIAPFLFENLRRHLGVRGLKST